MSEEKVRVTEEVHALLRHMQPEERVDFLAGMRGDYCRKCGYATGGKRCHCDNDE